MKNPWMAKNPFLSMWLSAANMMLGVARGHVLHEARRQQSAAANEAIRATLALWSGQGLRKPRGKRRAKPR